MISLWKWTSVRRTSKLVGFVFAWLLALSACSETNKPEEFAARVNDSFLTESELENKLADNRYSTKHREELIRDWIENEILFQEAESEAVLDDTLYKQIIYETQKKLAAALLVKKFFEENSVKISEGEIFQYYEEHREEFKFNTDVYVYNIIRFSDELKAIDFRNTLIETDWNKAGNAFSEDSSILFKSSGVLKHDYELNPPVVAKILKYLNENEVSIIFETEPGIYNVAQLIQKIDKNKIPPFRFVRKIVADRLSILKKHEMYKDYMDDLYSKYNVVINRYEE